MSNIVLFDMDGTLTLARKKIDNRMINSIIELLNYSDVGIVTGSGLDYLDEQCEALWNNDNFTPGKNGQSNLILFPCNGTKMLKRKNDKWLLSYERNMKDELGEESISIILKGLLKLQVKYVNDYFRKSPITGHFISSRGSLINWCPIGRSASDEDREVFLKIDKKYNIRLDLRDQITAWLLSNSVMGITVALGGDTSLDIYPAGWDKTHVFNNLSNDINAWFVGDRCRGTGNDRLIYEKLLPLGKSFQTSGPDETIDIVYDKIIPAVKNENWIRH